jgi:hypothetical protein
MFDELFFAASRPPARERTLARTWHREQVVLTLLTCAVRINQAFRWQSSRTAPVLAA